MAATVAGEYSALWQDPLRDYLKNVRAWHGYVHLLGMPSLSDKPDISIDELYVSPFLAQEYISPDTNPSDWLGTTPLLDQLSQQSRLVVLGDPGCGKSTIVDWLSFHLALPGDSSLKRLFGHLIPVPMVVRELHIGANLSWHGLLGAFLAHPMAKPLCDARILSDVLYQGFAFIMLDGLDEIGSEDVRKALRDAVKHGMEIYESCRWLLTSRIVGYDRVPFYLPRQPDEILDDIYGLSNYSGAVVSTPYTDEPTIPTAYVAPFNDRQVESVARNWYFVREQVTSEAERKATDVVNTVRGHDVLVRLSRVPNLLIVCC